MATILTSTCDVCGEPATYSTELATGRVINHERDMGQSVDLCDEHKPADDYPWQPRNAPDMYFRWGHPNAHPKRDE